MSTDKISLIALLAFILAYFSYKSHLDEKYPNRHEIIKKQYAQNIKHSDQAVEETRQHKMESENNLKNLSERSFTNVRHLDSNDLILENDSLTYKFNQTTAGIESITLKKYENEDGSGLVDLVGKDFILRGATSKLGLLSNLTFQGEKKDDEIIFSHYEGDWLIEQSFKMDKSGYGGVVSITWTNLSDRSQNLDSYVLMSDNISTLAEDSGVLPHVLKPGYSLITSANGKDDLRENIKELCTSETKKIEQKLQSIDYIGIDAHYFLKALLPNSKKLSFNVERVNNEREHTCHVDSWMYLTQGNIKAGDSVAMTFNTWMGPKSTELFDDYDSRLENSIDFGFFGVISKPLLQILKFFNQIFGNWGVAIIALTIFIKILFYPLVKKANIAQQKMKKLQPEIERIRKAHKDNPQQQQREMMAFMSKHKVNPMQGCLPMLPQLPVFIGLFRLLHNSIELRQAPFFGWITDLSVSDPYYVTPIILCFIMILQQKLMPTTGMDKAQERIMMLMPVFFSVIMFTFPAGLVLYNLTNSTVSIIQQQWLNNRLNSPKAVN